MRHGRHNDGLVLVALAVRDLTVGQDVCSFAERVHRLVEAAEGFLMFTPGIVPDPARWNLPHGRVGVEQGRAGRGGAKLDNLLCQASAVQDGLVVLVDSR